jgi:hypothetical protein
MGDQHVHTDAASLCGQLRQLQIGIIVARLTLKSKPMNKGLVEPDVAMFWV